MVVGEPGIGKTRLLEQFAAHARDAGARVLTGHCYDGDWAPPFSPFVEAIKQHAAATSTQRLRADIGADAGVLARIVPALHERLRNIAEPPQIPAEGERYRLLEAVSDTLARLAAERPLVLILDDLHWADKGTIAMLQQVARTSATQCILVLGAYRDVELDRTHPLADALTALRREKHFERIALHGLDGAEVAELLDTIAEQDVPAPLAEAIARETEGNPFFIKEVLLHLVEEGKIVQEDGAWTSNLSIAEMGIPEGVREVIGRRLSRVSETCGRMLTVASALTAGFSWEVISALVDVPDAALLDAIDEALGAQLIIERERGRYDFTHALIRHTLYEELSTPRRILMHRQIGEALERLYAADLEPHLAELAHHFYEADAGVGSVKAISLCEAAGDAALGSLAYDEGVVQFERALFLLDASATKDERRRIEMMLNLARTRFAAGVHSIDVFIAAAERARDGGEWDLVARAVLRDPFASGPGGSSAALWSLYDPRLPPLLDAALAGLPAEPSVLRACALAYRSNILSRVDAVSDQEERTAALDGVQEAQAMARALGDLTGLSFVLYWSQGVLWTDPRRRMAQIVDASELVELADQTGDRQMVRAGRMWRMFCLMSLGDPAMDEDLNLFHEMSEEFHIRVMTWWSNICVISRRLLTGEFAEAERLMTVCLSLAPPVSEAQPPEDGDAADVVGTFGQQLFALRRDQGRLAEVEPLVQKAVEQFPEILAWRAALATVYAESGRFEQARREIEPVLALGMARLQATPFFGITLPLLAELSAVLDERSLARELYDALTPCENLMLYSGWRVPIGCADRVLALLAALMGRGDDAERHFESALKIEENFGARPWVARTQLDYARMLRKRNSGGDPARARTLLDAALATAREIGMAKVAADCEALQAQDPVALLAVTPFVGRGDEIAALSNKLEAARAGRGSLTMLVGEPGIGKTRTLEEFCVHARTSGATVLWGRCYDGEWAAPFSPFSEMLVQFAANATDDELRAALGADAGVLVRITPAMRERLADITEPPAIPAEGERFRLLEAVTACLGRIAHEQPLVAVLDDLHWADAGTIAMLAHVARQVGAQPIVLLGTYRDVEVDATHPLPAALAGLRRETNFERIALDGLPAAAVGELIGLIARQDAPAALTDAIAGETAGNPFFIKEVLLELVEDRKIDLDDDAWAATLSVADMRIPEGVREVIGRRIARLSPVCLGMLTSASAMTGGITWAELQALHDGDDAALLDALDEALSAQIMRETAPSTYDFAHALIRHTLYEALSTPRRVLLHRKIGEALERLYAADVEPHLAELAHHFYHAGVGVDLGKAIEYCNRAGDAGMAGVAYDDAVMLYERSAELIRAQRPVDDHRLSLALLQLGLARFAAAVPSVDTFIEAAEAARRTGDFHLVIRAVLRDPRLDRARPSNAPLWPTEHDRFVSLLDDALEALADERSTLRACALAYRAFLIDRSQAAGSDPLAEDCLAAFREAERLVRDIGDPHALAYVLYWQQFMLNANPSLNEHERVVVDELIELARAIDDYALLRGAHMWRTFCLMKLGDPDMDDDLGRFHAMSQELRTAQASWWSSVCVAMRTMMRGDLAEAERLIIAAAEFGKDVAPDAPPETGDTADIAATFSQQFFVLRLHQGRLSEIERLIAGAVQQFPDIPAWRAAHALAYLEADRSIDARREYDEIVERGIHALQRTPFFDATLPILCEVAAMLEQPRAAEELFPLMLRFNHRMVDLGWRVSLGSADRYLGLLAMIMNRYDDAERHFDDAVVMNIRMGARPWVARTQLDYARMLRKRNAAGDAARARTLLDAALATAREIGMAKVAADCEALLSTTA